MATATQAAAGGRRKTGSGNGAPVALRKKGAEPSEEALRDACGKLGLRAPAGRGEAAVKAMLGLVRVELAKRLAKLPDEEQIECPDCLELSTADTDSCPYCGSAGDSGDAGDDGEAPGVGIAAQGEAASAQVIDAGTAKMEKRLAEKLRRIDELKRDMVGGTYDLGLEVKAIRDEQLFKARGYPSFSAFAQKELPFSRETALQLVNVCEKFTRADYVELGFAKLRAIASVSDAAKREQLVGEVRASGGKMTNAKVIEKARQVSGRAPRETVSGASRKSTPPPAAEKKDGLVTVLARVGDKPRAIGFLSVKTGKPLAEVAADKAKDAYAELRLSDDVVIRIGLRVGGSTGKKVTGLTVRFQRAEK